MSEFGIEGELAREHVGRLLAEAEKRRLVRMAAPSKSPSLRARMAKRLFEAAVVMERDAAHEAALQATLREELL